MLYNFRWSPLRRSLYLLFSHASWLTLETCFIKLSCTHRQWLPHFALFGQVFEFVEWEKELYVRAAIDQTGYFFNYSVAQHFGRLNWNGYCFESTYFRAYWLVSLNSLWPQLATSGGRMSHAAVTWATSISSRQNVSRLTSGIDPAKSTNETINNKHACVYAWNDAMCIENEERMYVMGVQMSKAGKQRAIEPKKTRCSRKEMTNIVLIRQCHFGADKSRYLWH